MAEIAAGPRTAPPDTFVETATRLRSIAVATFAGFLCGAVALGVGCRLAMRVVALLAGDADQGKLTDADALVGEVTVGGTIFLTLLGAAAGAIGGLLYLAVRRRLAWAGRWRGVVFGALLFAIFGSALVEGTNPDFNRFGIPIVNVAMFAGLFVFFGVLIAPVYDNLQRAVAAPSTTIAGYGLFAAQAAGMLLLLPATMLVMALLIADGGDAGFTALALVALFAYVLVVLPFASTMRRFRPALRSSRPRAIITAVAPLAPPLALGLALDVRELFAIF
jgi:hypothetical protein